MVKKTSKKPAAKKPAVQNKAIKVAEAQPVIELRLVEVAELFTVSPGVLMSDLSDDQYRRRKNRLIRVEGNGAHSDQSVYKSDEALQFKVGERFMVENEAIHKSHRAKLIQLD